MNELLDLKDLDGLSDEERAEVIKILKEYADEGYSKTYDNLIYEPYSEIPVDIETFLTDDKYLGKAWKDSNGKLKLYPFWLNTLKKIFPNNIATNYNTLLESGARGLGKAQPLDSLVLTENGFKRMGDIDFHDKVYGNDGKLHNIIGIFPQGVKPICKVTFNDKTSTLCCDEHLWKVYDINTKKWNVVETKQLIDFEKEFDSHRYKIPITQPIQFKKKELFIDPYVLGVLIGGGDLTLPTIKLTSADDEIIQNVSQRLDEEYQINKNKQKYEFSIVQRNPAEIYDKNRKMFMPQENKYKKVIEDYNLNVKSEYKHIPKDYLYSDVKDRIDLLQGLMDTDGYIDKPGNIIEYTTESEQLRNDIVWLVQSLGGVCKVREKNQKYKNKDEIIVSGQKCYNIGIKLPKDIIPFKLTRKRDRIKLKALDPSRYIESIEYVEEQECQCIVIDSEEHLYLTNDFIVTHNSEVACGAIAPYLMYRVMCLKNPLEYYGIKLTEKIYFAFMNIKLDLSKEIAMSKFQKTIQMSPWFMSRGTMSQKDNQPYWTPPDPLIIIIGSQADDVIGKPIFFCLDEDTIINTINGDYRIKELVGKKIKVKNIDNDGNIIISDECTVAITGESKEEYQIELEDNTIIKCTPNHKLMLKDGSYKEAQYLTEKDELMGISISDYPLEYEIEIKSVKHIYLDIPKKYYDVINATPYNNFLIKTKEQYILSHNCFFDEISFIKNQDIDKQKEKAKNMVDTAVAGMVTRFVIKGKNPCLLCIASSKRSEQSFMEQYILSTSESDPEKTYVVDKAVWEVKPKGTYSDETFAVGVGDKFHESIVIPDKENNEVGLEKYILDGYKILQVPIDFKTKFIDDVERSLCDYAGESSTSSNKYISPDAVKDIINLNYKNPFVKDVLEIGDAKEDVAQYKNFFDMNNVPKELMNKPLYVHLDMSETGDLTGIAGVWIVGKKVTTNGEPSNDLAFRVAFSVGIKAPKGHRVSFEKNRNFIRWLRERGFKVKTVSSDSYQSADLQQQLKAEGFECKVISVDRVTPDLICHSYQYLRSTIYEQRISMYKSDRVIEEMLDIERNQNTGKIDHTRNGHKDILDCICAATFEASQHAEEYAFDYGESIELMLKGNEGISKEDNKEQLQVAFENELMSMFDPMAIRQRTDIQNNQGKVDNSVKNNTEEKVIKKEENNAKFKENESKTKSPFIDFGLGSAQILKGSQYMQDGILFW